MTEKHFTTSDEDTALCLVEELEAKGLKKLPEGEELRPGYYDEWAGETENGNLVLGIDYYDVSE